MALQCEDCSLAGRCKTNKIDGEGPSKAPIMIVGDAPGFTDDDVGRPFQGDMGAKLRFQLQQLGLKKSQMFVTYAVKCKPWKIDQIKKDSIQGCRKHLFAEILQQRPKVIVAMGKFAYEMLTGEKDFQDARGFFDEFKLAYDTKLGKETFKAKIMPTYSPFTCLTKWKFDSIVAHDFKKVVKYLETGKLPQPPKITYDFVTDLKKLKEVTERLEKAETFSFDFETTGFDFHKHKIIMAGFSDSPDHAIVIPTHIYTEEEMKKKWTKAERDYVINVLNPFVKKNEKTIWAHIQRIFLSPARKTGQNAKFDSKFARANDITIRNWDFDTVIAHALVDENKPHNLTFMLDWFGIGFGNYERELWPYVNKTKANKKPYSHVPPPILALYLARDVVGTFRLRPILRKKLKQEGMFELFRDQQMPLIRLMTDMEYRGIKVDVEQLQNLSKKFAFILADCEEKLRKLTKNKRFNPNSSHDVLAYLEDIGAPLTKKTAGGKFSTDADVLEGLASTKKYSKMPKLVLEHRTISKLKGTYLDGKKGDGGILSWVDKHYKVHANWNAHTPRTGRMSCDDPPLQTIPRPNPKYPDANIRQLFIVSVLGWLMFSIDYKQLEMRIAAYLSRDMVMIKEIRDNVDIHSRNAVMFGTVLGILPADMTEQKFVKIVKWEKPQGRELTEEEKKMLQLSLEYSELRTLAKSLGFGLNYGIEASTLAKDYNRDEEEVQEMIDLYFRKYQSLALWREEQKQIAVNKGLLVLPITGRKRRFLDAAKWFNSPLSKDCFKRQMDIQGVERQAMNFPIQGLANEIFTKGKLKLAAAMKKEKLKAKLLLSLHDGVLGETPPKEVEIIKRLAKENMEFTLGKGKKYEVHLGIDFDVYDRWAGNKVKVV